MTRQIAFAPISYLIATHGGPRQVQGYAVRLPAPLQNLRICVRKHSTGSGWTTDHYDTGFAIRGPIVSVFVTDKRSLAQMRRYEISGRTRAEITRAAINSLRWSCRTGALQKHLEAIGLSL